MILQTRVGFPGSGTTIAEPAVMRNFLMVCALAIVLPGCGGKATGDLPTGSDVTVEKTNGVTVAGRLVDVLPEHVVVESLDGVKTRVARSEIASMRARPVADERKEAAAPAAPQAPAPPAPRPGTRATAAETDAREADASATAAASRPARVVNRTREYREVTLPAGTALTVELTTSVGSDTSSVEDAVRGRLQNAVRTDGVEALPVGTALLGHVTSAVPAGKVKGVSSIAFRFNTIDLPGDSGREPVSTATYTRSSRTTKKKDATKIGIGAGAGAVIGGILGGGSGAAKGAAIGGGAGTAVVLSTKGDEVGIPAGTPVTIKLTAPFTVRVLEN